MVIEFMIVVTNIGSMILINFLVMNYIKSKEITSYSKTIQSFMKSKKILDLLQHRYVEQLFIRDYIHIKELVIYYTYFVIGAILTRCLFMPSNLISNILIAVIIILPIAVLEQMRRKMDRKIDKGIFQLLTQINARLIKSEDILKAISETEKTITNKPIHHLIRQFNQAIKIGLPPENAFEKVQFQCLNEYFCYLFTNINIVYQRRGNVSELMKALENEYTSIQIEINKRKTELEHDRNMIGLSILIVFAISYKITKDNDYIVEFYLRHTGIGIFFSLMVCVGIFFAVVGSFSRY